MLHCWKLQFCLDIFSYFTALWSLYKKWCFQLKISSVNVIKIHSFLVTFTEEMLNGKLHFCALGVLVEIFLIYLLFQFRSKLEFFFLSGFSFTNTEDLRDSRGLSLFLSTTSTCSATFKNLLVVLHLRLLPHIFKHSAC